MKPLALFAAANLAVAAVGCGGAAESVASQSDAATISCGTPTLGAIVPTDCSALTGADQATCLIGTPPVCAITKPGSCSCTGEGSDLYLAAQTVGLCGNNPAQTRAGLLSALCAATVNLASGDLGKACAKIQDFEGKVYEKQIKATNKDINTVDADALRAAAQDVEAAIGAGCLAVTPVL